MTTTISVDVERATVRLPDTSREHPFGTVQIQTEDTIVNLGSARIYATLLERLIVAYLEGNSDDDTELVTTLARYGFRQVEGQS